ncbi:MAG: MATE family multidrug resistance protein [Maribacter sp.]|jgi:MATE family multidrug resistance protein
MFHNFKTHFRRIGEISFPLTLATASGTFLILIDSFFATRISIESYEAVFLTLPIMALATGVGVGLSAAIADLISKETELTKIKRFISASFILAIASIIGFLLVSVFKNDLIEDIAGIAQLDKSSIIATEFRNYWKVILWTFPLQIFFSMSVQFLTILEKQKKGLYIIVCNIILNILLDYYFTIYLGWGVEGLAYSTMGVFAAGVFLSIFMLRKEAFFQSPYPTIFDKWALSSLLKMTSTTSLIFISIGIFSISSIILNKIALGISTSALVVLAIYSQVMQIFIITTRGLAGGFLIYFGNALRDKATADYFPIYWAATAWMAVFNGTGVILMIAMPETLIHLFENVEATLIPEIIYFMSIGALIMTIYILPRMATIGFISLNKAPLLVAHSILFVTIQIFAATYWTQSYGTNGLIHAELVAATISSVLFLPLFYYFLRSEKINVVDIKYTVK